MTSQSPDAARRRGQRWLVGTVLALVAVVGGVAVLARLGDGGTPTDTMPGMDMGEMPMGGMTTTSTSQPIASRDPETVTLALDRYAIGPSRLTLTPGAYRFAAANGDAVPHDVVLIRTDLPVESLPTVDVRVDESSLDVRARTSVINGGSTGDLVAEVEPGRYVLVCTVPHHYVRERMIAELVVTS